MLVLSAGYFLGSFTIFGWLVKLSISYLDTRHGCRNETTTNDSDGCVEYANVLSSVFFFRAPPVLPSFLIKYASYADLDRVRLELGRLGASAVGSSTPLPRHTAQLYVSPCLCNQSVFLRPGHAWAATWTLTWPLGGWPVAHGLTDHIHKAG